MFSAKLEVIIIKVVNLINNHWLQLYFDQSVIN